MMGSQRIVIIAGPNGAGKTTFAAEFLPNEADSGIARSRRQSPMKTSGKHTSKDPDILASAVALRRAAKRARQLGEQTGTPVWVVKRGKIVDLTAERHARSKRSR